MYDVVVPPADEYESVSSWLAAWPEGTTACVEHDDGTISLVTPEDIIDGIALWPLIKQMLIAEFDSW